MRCVRDATSRGRRRAGASRTPEPKRHSVSYRSCQLPGLSQSAYQVRGPTSPVTGVIWRLR